MEQVSVISAPKPAEGRPERIVMRVNIAFVQNAEHDVHHQDGDHQQDPQIAQRILECLGRALEAGADGVGQSLVGELLTGAHDIAQSVAGLEVEGNGHGRERAVMVDGLRPDVRVEPGQRIERNQLAGGALKYSIESACWIGLIFRVRARAELCTR